MTSEGLGDLLKQGTARNTGAVFADSFERETVWSRFRVPLFSMVGICTIFLAYCGYVQGRYFLPATRAVGVFHERFSKLQDDAIIGDLATGIGGMEPEVTRRYLARVRTVMGTCKYEGPVGWKANTNLNGRTTIVLNYRAQCSKGPMRERFSFRIDDGRPWLVAYRAVSDRLQMD